MCEFCRTVKRRGRVFVLCTANPKHKQRQGLSTISYEEGSFTSSCKNPIESCNGILDQPLILLADDACSFGLVYTDCMISVDKFIDLNGCLWMFGVGCDSALVVENLSEMQMTRSSYQAKDASSSYGSGVGLASLLVERKVPALFAGWRVSLASLLQSRAK
ncbi:ribosomal protein L36 [Tanacetum coccineum]